MIKHDVHVNNIKTQNIMSVNSINHDVHTSNLPNIILMAS